MRAAAHEDGVRAAAVGARGGRGCGTRSPAGRGGGGCATCAPSGALAPRRRAEPGRPPRRHLLQQRDVPLPARQRAAELDEQRAPGGRLGAAVEEVPGQDSNPRGDRSPRPVHSPACRATSSRAPSSPPPSWPRSWTARWPSRRRRSPRARWRAAASRSSSSSPPRAPAPRSRRASSSSAGTRWSCGRASCSSRAASPCATRRSSSPATSRRSACARARRRRWPSWPRTPPCPW